MIYNLSLVSPLYRATTVTTLHNIMLVLPPASCHPLITHSSIVLLSLFVVDITSCSLSGLVYRLRPPLLVIAVLQHKMMNNFLLSSKNKGPAANGGVPSAGPSNLVAPYHFTRFGNSAFCIIHILQQPGAFILLCVFIWRLGVRGRFQPLLDSVRRAFPHPASTFFDAKPEGAF